MYTECLLNTKEKEKNNIIMIWPHLATETSKRAHAFSLSLSLYLSLGCWLL